jgi:hypothetical protein
MIRATTNMLQKTAYKKELKIKKKQHFGVLIPFGPL